MKRIHRPFGKFVPDKAASPLDVIRFIPQDVGNSIGQISAPHFSLSTFGNHAIDLNWHGSHDFSSFWLLNDEACEIHMHFWQVDGK